MVIVWQSFKTFWADVKLSLFVCEPYFLEFYWCRYQDSKRYGGSVYPYLDDLVRELRPEVNNPGMPLTRRKRIAGDLLSGLYNRWIRREIVAYLENAAISREDTLELCRKIRAHWRMEGPEGTALVAVPAAEAFLEPASPGAVSPE